VVRMRMMAMTIISSMSVKPDSGWRFAFNDFFFRGPGAKAPWPYCRAFVRRD
jgi:hypothetical protein